MEGLIKTYENWCASGLDLSQFLRIGDVVDEEMADYFIEVLPPITMTGQLVQMGEPHSHREGRATYSTLERVGSNWIYRGHCHRGQTRHFD